MSKTHVEVLVPRDIEPDLWAAGGVLRDLAASAARGQQSEFIAMLFSGTVSGGRFGESVVGVLEKMAEAVETAAGALRAER